MYFTNPPDLLRCLVFIKVKKPTEGQPLAVPLSMTERKPLTLQVACPRCAVAPSFLVSEQGLVMLLGTALTRLWVPFIMILKNSLFIDIFQSGRDKEEKWGFPVIIKDDSGNLEGRENWVYSFGFWLSRLLSFSTQVCLKFVLHWWSSISKQRVQHRSSLCTMAHEYDAHFVSLNVSNTLFATAWMQFSSWPSKGSCRLVWTVLWLHKPEILKQEHFPEDLSVSLNFWIFTVISRDDSIKYLTAGCEQELFIFS